MSEMITTAPEFRRGVLALKGGRLEEAEEHFMGLAEETNEPTAWAAAAKAKLWRVPSGDTTVEEVSYCFGVARDFCETEDEARVIQKTLAESTLEMIAYCYALMSNVRKQGQAVSSRAFTAVAFGGAAALVGTNSRSLFGSLASYDVFSRSLDSVQSSFEDGDDVVAEGTRVTQLVIELCAFLRRAAPEFIPALDLLESQPEIIELSNFAHHIDGTKQLPAPTPENPGVIETLDSFVTKALIWTILLTLGIAVFAAFWWIILPLGFIAVIVAVVNALSKGAQT